MYRQFEDGDVIFVGCQSVAYFASAVFPLINTTFILVYNNCDEQMPTSDKGFDTT